MSSPAPDGEAYQARRLADAERLRELISQASASVSAPDHTVSVTMSPGNTVTDIELTRQALRHDPHTLGQLLVDTIAAATAQLDARLAADTAGLAPPGVDVIANLRGTLPAPVDLDDLGHEPGLSDLDALADEVEDEDDIDDVPMPAEWAERLGVDPADNALAKIEQLEQQARQQAARYAEIYDDLTNLTASAASPDGGITVTVRTGGVVAAITLEESAYRHGPTQLSHQVRSAIQQATALVANRAAEQVQEVMGATLDVRAMVASYLPDDVDLDDLTSNEPREQ